ncbi:MAG: RnfABCDGE type electron transport complex subunit D [Candidatus Aminicenantes bacterium]|nr:MAG: RnfABCDGE type electron transport complex subunit D [Candidatus Aminicenantes bacterium]
MTALRARLPNKPFMMQKPMLRVCYALIPLVLASIYLFGWRSFALAGLVLVCGIMTEAFFTFPRGKPVTSAVFVTGLIFTLSLPPTIPFWMAAIGIVVGVALGKMVFGGFGQNVFNPAMVGRCFIYITFPLQMTNRWVEPFWDVAGGLTHWSASLDSLSQATPLEVLRLGESLPFQDLLLGRSSGSIGEMSAFLILLGGIFIVVKKAASWRLALSCLLGGICCSGLLRLAGFNQIPDPVSTLLAGSFLFGTFFIVTEPVSGAKTKIGQWIYGSMIGVLIVILRGFSNFSEGVMFSVLIMNAFVPILDQTIRQIQAKRRP